MAEMQIQILCFTKEYSQLQSHAPDYQYHITYTVEPMFEVLWRAEDVHDETRYKVLFPISTPPMPYPPHAEDRKYLLHLGGLRSWRTL